MGYRLHLTKRFIKDAKTLAKQDIEHTMEVLQKLCNGEVLDSKYRDHPLSGDLQGARDCHIKSDLILIYRCDKEVLEVVALRIGKHSKVLK